MKAFWMLFREWRHELEWYVLGHLIGFFFHRYLYKKKEKP